MLYGIAVNGKLSIFDTISHKASLYNTIDANDVRMPASMMIAQGDPIKVLDSPPAMEAQAIAHGCVRQSPYTLDRAAANCRVAVL